VTAETKLPRSCTDQYAIATRQPPPRFPVPHHNIHHNMPTHAFGATGSAPESRYFGYFNDRVFTQPQGDGSMKHRGTPSYPPARYRGEHMFNEGISEAQGTSRGGSYAGDYGRGHAIPYVGGHDERSGFPYAGEYDGGRRRSQAGGHGRGAAYDQYGMNPGAASQDTDITMGNAGTQDPPSAKKRKNRCCVFSANHRSISLACSSSKATIVDNMAEIAETADVEMRPVHVVEPDTGPRKLPEHNILARSWSKDDKKSEQGLDL